MFENHTNNNIQKIIVLMIFTVFAFNLNLNGKQNGSYLKIQTENDTGVAVENKMWEHILTSQNSYPNPYKDVILQVRYWNDDSTTVYETYGFWDGDSTFKIRYYFPASGIWHWRTFCSDTTNSGLHGISGTVSVSEYNGNNKIYLHGGLKVSDNKRYLTYADGTPFFWMGGTAWPLPMSATFDQWKKYIDDRHSKKFTVVQIAPAKAHGYTEFTSYPVNRKGDVCFFSDDKWNPAYWQEFDKFVEYANSKGMVVLLVGLAEPVYDKLTNDDAELFARNINARMEGYHVILSPAFDTYQPQWNADYDSTGFTLTYSKQLISQHAGHSYSDTELNEFVRPFKDKEYMEIALNQTGHNGGDLEKCYRKARKWNINLYNLPPVLPVINTEAYYSAGKYAPQIINPERQGTDENARELGWISVLSGSCGYTYGALGIWNYPEDSDDELYIPFDTAMSYISSTQMKYIVEFFESFNWWELVPRHEAVLNNDNLPEIRKMVLAVAESGKFGAAFLPGNDSISIDMQVFSNNVDAFWFNPVNGKFTTGEKNVANNGIHSFFPPSPGEWALFLNDADTAVISWESEITVKQTDTNSVTLVFGKSGYGTNAVDKFLGEEQLPPAQPGSFDVRFLLDDNSTTRVDFRNDLNDEITWKIKFRRNSNNDTVKFYWNKNNLPYGSFFLRDTIDGSYINLNMKNTDSLILNDANTCELLIAYKNEDNSLLDFSAGWNLISVPLLANDMSIRGIFGNDSATVLKYDTVYKAEETLQIGVGYWLKQSNNGSRIIYGNESGQKVKINKGWNLIGVFKQPVVASNIKTNPPGLISSSFFEFDKFYKPVDILLPGKGYWVKSNGEGEIDVSIQNSNRTNPDPETVKQPQIYIGMIASNCNDTIPLVFGLDSLASINPDVNFGEFEIPPPPPDGIFDVRIISDAAPVSSYSNIENISGKYHKCKLNYQSASDCDSIKLKWELPHGVTLNIKDTAEGSKINSDFTEGEGELILTGNEIGELLLTFYYSDVLLSNRETENLSFKFDLMQNFPNPFNPSTTIKYSIPSPLNVTLTVYDVLGRKVATLVNGKQPPGQYSIHFDALSATGGLPSGIYFYKLKAGNLRKVRKMLLIK